MAIDPIQKTASSSQPINTIDPASIQRSLQMHDPKARAEAVANQLESVFMGMVLKAMRDTVPEDGLAGKSLGGKNYVEMLDQHYSQLQNIPKDPRFHEALVRQITQTPETANSAMQRLNEGASKAQSATLNGKSLK